MKTILAILLMLAFNATLCCGAGDEFREMTLWGVNLQPCLSWEYNSRLKKMGVELSDLHQVIDNNLEELVKMKVNMIRCHLTPADFTDSKGNLIETPFLDALDYMIAKAAEKDIKTTLALINHMGNRYVDDSFMNNITREDWIHLKAARECSANYISQLLGRTNRYTGRKYASEKMIAYWELINEPAMYSWKGIQEPERKAAWIEFAEWAEKNGKRKDKDSYAGFRTEIVQGYIDDMCSLIKECGSEHPVVWSHNWHRYRDGNRDIFDGVLKSEADAVACCNYPGQDYVAQDYWNSPVDLTARDYADWFNTYYDNVDGYGWMNLPEYSSKAKIVYEFETFFNQSTYLYPVQALYFRSLGVQAASMWTYCMKEYAQYHAGSHFLSLTCTPGKSVGFIIAQQIFKETPLGQGYDRKVNEIVTDNYVISKEHDLAVWSDSEKFYHTRDVSSYCPISVSDEVKEIIGIGSSPIVSYSGTGIYFINDTEDGLMVSLMPDHKWLQEPWDSRSKGKVSDLDYDTLNSIDIRLKDWGEGNYTIWRINRQKRQEIGKATSLTGLELRPGDYLITADADDFNSSFVSVSEDNPHYFTIGTDGTPYIPIGCNIAAVGSIPEMETYIRHIHENGGNFGRVWLNSSLFEIEKKYGSIDTVQLGHIDALLALVAKYEIKVKLCIESFRHIVPGRNKWDTKASYHVSNGGPFENMEEYICSDNGKDEFLKRLGVLQRRYGSHPAVFGWELWNEMNAVNAPEDSMIEWNKYMLPKVKEMFPDNMVMQSLGSLDNTKSFHVYECINAMPENEVSQVHRYLDEGAPLKICQAPVDVFCADAVEHIRKIGWDKPLLLAESGAVKPVHTGPSALYPKDTLGTILHDVLFAPFFCGAAGPGHLWHWDHHIIRQDTWFQMQRFANAVDGIDPIKENFVPLRKDTANLRVYVLKGEKTTLVWCRDTESTWESELEQGVPAALISGVEIDLSDISENEKLTAVKFYDPWEDSWTMLALDGRIALPDFRRSAVIRIEH